MRILLNIGIVDWNHELVCSTSLKINETRDLANFEYLHGQYTNCQLFDWTSHSWLTELWFFVPLDTKYVISETLPKPISWLGVEKLNLTQQKHTFTNQKKCTTTQNKHNKLKPGLDASYDIRPGKGEGLFLFRRFINLLLTYLDT